MGLLIFKGIKWILIILLMLILLLLGLVLLLLVSAISYQAKGSYFEKIPHIQGRVSYLFGLIKCAFSYEDTLLLKVKILGIPVYGLPKKEKRKKKSEFSKAREKTSTVNKPTEEKKTEEIIAEDTVVENNAMENTAAESIVFQETVGTQQETISKADKKSQKAKQSNKKLKTKKEKHHAGEKRFSLEKLKSWKSFFENPKIKTALLDCKEKLFRVLKAILPKKWCVVAKFGFADPSVTGKVMAVLGILYPVVGNHIVAIPFFEEERLEIEGEIKGKLRPIQLLWQAVLLILNKDVRYLIKAARKQMA